MNDREETRRKQKGWGENGKMGRRKPKIIHLSDPRARTWHFVSLESRFLIRRPDSCWCHVWRILRRVMRRARVTVWGGSQKSRMAGEEKKKRQRFKKVGTAGWVEDEERQRVEERTYYLWDARTNEKSRWDGGDGADKRQEEKRCTIPGWGKFGGMNQAVAQAELNDPILELTSRKRFKCIYIHKYNQFIKM